MSQKKFILFLTQNDHQNVPIQTSNNLKYILSIHLLSPLYIADFFFLSNLLDLLLILINLPANPPLSLNNSRKILGWGSNYYRVRHNWIWRIGKCTEDEARIISERHLISITGWKLKLSAWLTEINRRSQNLVSFLRCKSHF